MKYFILITAFFLFATSARAEDADFLVIKSFADAVKNREYNTAQKYTTTGSADLYAKLVKYDLSALTPTNLRFVSKTKNGDQRLVKVAGTNAQGREGLTTIAVVNENNEAKIDMPKSMSYHFGQNWQQKIGMMEQSYAFAKQNFGEQQSQQLLYKLLQK